jgi:ABC-type Fe3+ transport system permease subunit
VRLSDGARRTLRTLIQLAVALPTVVPALAAGIGWLAGQVGADHLLVRWGAAVMVGVTAVTRAMAWAEDHGWIAPILRELGDEQSTS